MGGGDFRDSETGIEAQLFNTFVKSTEHRSSGAFRLLGFVASYFATTGHMSGLDKRISGLRFRCSDSDDLMVQGLRKLVSRTVHRAVAQRDGSRNPVLDPQHRKSLNRDANQGHSNSRRYRFQ